MPMDMMWSWPTMWGWFAGLALFGVLILAIVFIFWLWMLTDCLKRRKFEDKLVWALVMIFLNVLGAVLYFILIYSKRR